MFDRYYGSRMGKQFIIFQRFVASIRSKERAMIIGPDYVVVTKEIYDDWMEKLKTTTHYIKSKGAK